MSLYAHSPLSGPTLYKKGCNSKHCRLHIPCDEDASIENGWRTSPRAAYLDWATLTTGPRANAAAVKHAAGELRSVIEGKCPPCAGKLLALDALDECIKYAAASIAGSGAKGVEIDGDR